MCHNIMGHKIMGHKIMGVKIENIYRIWGSQEKVRRISLIN
jgi:hypothetical protein